MLRDREKLIFLALAGGFFVLFLDVRFEHRNEVLSRWESWIPIYYGLVASVCSLLSVWFLPRVRWVVAGVFGLGLIVSGLGVYFHVDGDWGGLMEILKASPKYESFGPPLVAPLGIGGLAIVGLILALVRPKVETAD
jgi:hypothetical protein